MTTVRPVFHIKKTTSSEEFIFKIINKCVHKTKELGQAAERPRLKIYAQSRIRKHSAQARAVPCHFRPMLHSIQMLLKTLLIIQNPCAHLAVITANTELLLTVLILSTGKHTLHGNNLRVGHSRQLHSTLSSLPSCHLIFH
jgi:hypothetical protein